MDMRTGVRCVFCHKLKDEVEVMIAYSKTGICSRCVYVCLRILDGHFRGEASSQSSDKRPAVELAASRLRAISHMAQDTATACTTKALTPNGLINLSTRLAGLVSEAGALCDMLNHAEVPAGSLSHVRAQVASAVEPLDHDLLNPLRERIDELLLRPALQGLNGQESLSTEREVTVGIIL